MVMDTVPASVICHLASGSGLASAFDDRVQFFFSSPEQSLRRAIVLPGPLALALAKCNLKFYVKVFKMSFFLNL